MNRAERVFAAVQSRPMSGRLFLVSIPRRDSTTRARNEIDQRRDVRPEPDISLSCCHQLLSPTTVPDFAFPRVVGVMAMLRQLAKKPLRMLSGIPE